MRKLFNIIKKKLKGSEKQKFTITVESDNPNEFVGQVEAWEGETVLNVLRREEVDISYYCGGNCSCGTCIINVLEGELSEIGGREQLVLGVVPSRERLACQARVREDIRIEIIQKF
jgi:ferredoxin